MAKDKNATPTLALMIDSLNKDYPGAMRQVVEPSSIRRVQTGVFQIDRILQGGLALNRPNLILGQKGSFKTTLGLKALFNFFLQGHDGYCVYIDTEHALDEGLVHRVVRQFADRVHIFRPDYGELACEYAERFSTLPEVGAVIIDSLADLNGKSELEKGYFDSISRGIRARLISRMTRALISIIDVPQPKLAIMVNHLLPLQDGQGEYAPGGKTPVYNSSVVLKLWTTGLTDNKLAFKDFDPDKPTVRQKDIGFLVQHSKISHDNVSGEYSLFIEDSQKNSIHYGDANEHELVFIYHKLVGLIGEKAPFALYGQEFKNGIAIYRYWRDDPAFYMQVKEELIEKLKERQGGQR